MIALIACGLLAIAHAAPAFDAVSMESLASAAAEKINVTLYMESYCPFCKKFVSNQLKDLWDAKDLRDRIQIHLEPGVFAQKMPADKKKKTKAKWNCLHGNKECKLDRFQLCVMDKYKHDQSVWFPFIMCLESFKGKGGGLKVLEKCSKKHKIAYAPMKKCADGAQGEKLLLAQQPKEDAFLAEPDTKKFVKNTAVDAFKQAIAQAYGALGSTDEALKDVKKIFNDEIAKLAAKPKDKKGKQGKQGKQAPKRSFLPFVPLFTIMEKGKQKIIQMKDPKVSAISAVCDAIKGTKPASCTKKDKKDKKGSSSSSEPALASANKDKKMKDEIAGAYKGGLKDKDGLKTVVAKIKATAKAK